MGLDRWLHVREDPLAVVSRNLSSQERLSWKRQRGVAGAVAEATTGHGTGDGAGGGSSTRIDGTRTSAHALGGGGADRSRGSGEFTSHATRVSGSSLFSNEPSFRDHHLNV